MDDYANEYLQLASMKEQIKQLENMNEDAILDQDR